MLGTKKKLFAKSKKEETIFAKEILHPTKPPKIFFVKYAWIQEPFFIAKTIASVAIFDVFKEAS